MLSSTTTMEPGRLAAKVGLQQQLVDVDETAVETGEAPAAKNSRHNKIDG